MPVLNINSADNTKKTTVSKILEQKISGSICLSANGSLKNRNKTTSVLNITLISNLDELPTDEDFPDLIISNDNQSPEETANIILDFVQHTQNPTQQWLHLVERRWPALVSGEKTSTFRLNEGFVHRGFLVYKDCPNEQFAEVVYINKVYYVPLHQAIALDGFDNHTPDEATALKQMQVHYPDITLDTPILLAQHLSVPETKKKYPQEIQHILKKIK